MNFVLFLLLATAFVVIQCLIGGNRMAYALGPYALLGGAAFLSLCSLRKEIIKPSTWCIGSTLLFCAYIVGRALYSPNAYLARPDLCLALACLAVYLLTSLYITQARFRTGMALTLCLMAMVQVFFGALQFVAADSFVFHGFTRPFIYASQASGMFVNPNHFAAYLNAAGLFALSYTIWGRYSLAMKIFTGYLLLVCIGGVAISGSKPGYLGAFLGIVIFTAVSLWIVNLYKEAQFPLALMGSIIIVTGVIGTTLILMQNSVILRDRLTQMTHVNQDTHLYQWKAAVDQITLSPILGTGSGTHAIYQRLFRRAPVQTDVTDAHSDYLDLVAEYGALGGGLGLIFLLIHLATGLRNIREIAQSRLMNIFGPPRTNSMALMVGAFTASVTLLLQSILNSNLHAPVNALLLAFCLGILSNAGINSDSKERPATLQLGFRRLLGLAGLILLALSLRWYHAETLSNHARRAVETRQYDLANTLAQQAIAQDPANPFNYYYRGEALRNLAAAAETPAPQRPDLYTQAIDLFKQGLKRFPKNELLCIRLGQALDATHQFQQAENIYIQAIANDPNLGILYAYYAEHLRISGDKGGALECADAARALALPQRKRTDLEDPLPVLDVGAPSLQNLKW